EPVARDGRTIWYPATAALERVYLGEELDLTRERARLAKEQADAQELKNAQARGELIPPEEMDRAVIALNTVVSSRMQGLGVALAPKLAAEGNRAHCQEIVDGAVATALHELADAATEAGARDVQGRTAKAPSSSRRKRQKRASGGAARAKADDSRLGRAAPNRRSRH
ncbi:MAG: hypothetical protein ACYTGV_18285, partial [Planctomycetota bacterium]